MSNAINLGGVQYSIAVQLGGASPQRIEQIAAAMERLGKAGGILPGVFSEISAKTKNSGLDQFFANLAKSSGSTRKATDSLKQFSDAFQRAGSTAQSEATKIINALNRINGAMSSGPVAGLLGGPGQRLRLTHDPASVITGRWEGAAGEIWHFNAALERAIPNMVKFAKEQRQITISSTGVKNVLETEYAATQKLARGYREAALAFNHMMANPRTRSQFGPDAAVHLSRMESAVQADVAQKYTAMQGRGWIGLPSLWKSGAEVAEKQAAAREQAQFTKQQEDANKQIDKGANSLRDYSAALTAVGYAMAASGLDRIGDKFQEIAVSAAMLAGRVEVLGIVLKNVGAQTGYAGGELDVMERKVRDLGITTQAAREGMTLLARNQLDLSKATQLARLAQDAAVIAGENSSEAFDKIAIAIQRLDTRLLRNRGIMINLRQLYQQHALQTGRVETTLTAQEKQQILLNAVLAKGSEIYNSYLSAMNSAAKRWYSLDRLIEEASRNIGQYYQPAFSALVDAMTAALELFNRSEGLQQFTASMLAGSTVAVRLAQGVLNAGAAFLSFVWMADMAKKSMIALGAQATVTGRMVGIFTSIIAKPGPFLVLLGVIGATTAAIMYFMSAIERQKQEFEEARIKATEYNDQIIEMHGAIQGLEQARATFDNTAAAHAHLNASLQELLMIAGPYENALRRIWQTTQSYAKVLEAARKVDPMLKMSGAELESAYRSRIRALQVEDKILEARLSKFGKGDTDTWTERAMSGMTGGAGVQEYMSATADVMQRRREEIAVQLSADRAALEKLDASRQRFLQNMLDRQEVAVGLALRAESQLQQERERLYDSANLKILQGVNDFNEKINASYMSSEQILERSRLAAIMKIYATYKTFQDRIEKAGGVGTPEGRDVISERDAVIARLQEDINRETRQQLQDRRLVLDTQESIYKLAEMQLRVEQDKTRMLKEQNDMRQEFLRQVPALPSEVGTEAANQAMRAVSIAERELSVQERQLKITQELRAENERMLRVREEFTRQQSGDPTASPKTRDELRAAAKAAQEEYDKARKGLNNGVMRLPGDEDVVNGLRERALAAAQLAADAELDYEEASTGLDDLIEKTQQEIAALEKLSDTEDARAELEHRLQNLLEKRKTLASTLASEEARHAEVVRGLTNDRVDLERDAQKEVLKLREELTDRIRQLSKDETAYTAEEARRRLEIRYNEFEQVRDFIRRERIGIMSQRMPGISDAAQIYSSYSEQIAKASSGRQLQWLQSLSRQRFAGVLTDVQSQGREAMQQFAQAKTPQERMAAQKKIVDLQRQYVELSRYVQQFEGSLGREIAKRGSELGKVQSERQREIALVEQALEQSYRQLGVLGDQFDMRRALNDELAVTVQLEKAVAIAQGRDVSGVAGAEAAAQQARAAAGGSATRVQAIRSGQGQAMRIVAPVAGQIAGGAGNMEGPEVQWDMRDVLPPQRGQFKTWLDWQKEYRGWAGRRQGDRVADWTGRQQQWMGDSFIYGWQNAKTWKERQALMRAHKGWEYGAERQRRQWAFQEGKSDRKWAFENFGPGMRNPFPQIPIQPPAQLPDAQRGLIDRAISPAERANAELNRAVGQVKAAMDQVANLSQVNIQASQQLAAHAQQFIQDNQKNIADAENVLQMIQV